MSSTIVSPEDTALDAVMNRCRVEAADLMRQGRLEEALFIARDTIDWGVQNDSLLAQASGQYQAGRICFQRGDHPEARSHLLACHDAYERIGHKTGMSAATGMLGNIAHQEGEYPDSIRHYRHAIQYARDAGDRQTEVTALCNLARPYEALGDFGTAVEASHEALAFFEEAGDRARTGIILGSLASLYLDLNRPGEAVSYAERALLLLEDVGDVVHAAQLYQILGAAWTKNGEPERGLAYLQQSAERLEQVGNVVYISNTLLLSASALQELKRWEEARACLERVLTISETDPSGSIPRLEAQIALGTLHCHPEYAGRDEEAGIRLLHQAHRHGQEIANATFLVQVYRALADVHERRGELAEALAHHRLLYTTDKQRFNETSDKRMRSLQVRYEVEQARKDAEIAHLRSVELAAALAEAERLRAEADARAQTDGLTGLPNRRQMDQRLGQEMERAFLQRHSLAAALIDIDFFKKINDRFGHLIGDEALRQVARLLRDECRENDFVARYGGEEFALLLPETGIDQARQVCERLRHRLESQDWSAVLPTPLTVSIGIGLVDGGSESALHDADSLLKAADANLYAAKAAGRNQVAG